MEPTSTTKTSQTREHLFLVRIWQEGARESNTVWRGSVEHVPTGQRIYFTSLRDLDDFISLKLQQWQTPIRDEPQAHQDTHHP